MLDLSAPKLLIHDHNGLELASFDYETGKAVVSEGVTPETIVRALANTFRPGALHHSQCSEQKMDSARSPSEHS